MPDKTAIAVGLDAGSAQTRCLILAMEEGRLRTCDDELVPPGRGNGVIDRQSSHRRKHGTGLDQCVLEGTGLLLRRKIASIRPHAKSPSSCWSRASIRSMLT